MSEPEIERVSTRIAAAILAFPDLTMAFIEKVDDCAAYTCATPAELTAALDRLAEEAPRG